MKTDVIIHVGYGKTATTWLQEKIFNSLGEDIYLGKRESSYPNWLLKINYLDEFAYQKEKKSIRKEIAPLFANKNKVVISSEAFTNFNVVYQQIERISYLFNEPRIVLVLRHPIDWLLSNYKYCVDYEHFFRPLEAYIDYGERRTPFALEKRAPFYVPDLFFDEVVERYRYVFGKGNVLVLRYEDFITDPKTFGDWLSGFMGIDLPCFLEKARHKVLESRSEQLVDEQRTINAAKYLDDSGFCVDNITMIPEKQWGVSAEGMNTLRKIFTPHCKEFYPELGV